MVLHLPHASTDIPPAFRDQFVLTDDELDAENLTMTDRYTDQLFVRPSAKKVAFAYSRLLVDVERFSDEDNEPMSSVGMGMIYTKTSDGRQLRGALSADDRKELESLYNDHHNLLQNAVGQELELNDAVLIVDCHSFPDTPLACDTNTETPRPDFCVGLDPFHTPDRLVRIATSALSARGWSVGIDWPYAGAIVPMAFYQADPNVSSIMIEVNRRLYMDEKTGEKSAAFSTVAQHISSLLDALDKGTLA